MSIFPDGEFQDVATRFDGELLAARIESGRKKRRYAYLAWMCLGSHHLYLGRPGRQLLFWITAGGLLFWWIRDFFRVPALVRARNLRSVRDLLERWPEPPRRPVPERPSTAPPAQPHWHLNDLPSEQAGPPGQVVLGQPLPVRAGRDASALSGFVFAGGMAAALVLYVAAPLPLASQAAAEPAFRTLRKVNVRELPSTASPIRAVARKDVVLTGRIEKVGSKQWLWVTRGPHSDRYVSLDNLKRR